MSTVSLPASPTMGTTEHYALPFRFWMTVFVIGAAFFLTEHDTTISKADAYTSTADQMEQAAQGGNNTRRVAFLTIAAIGFCGFCYSNRQFSLPANLLGLAAMTFIAWCAASSLWSDDMGMTIRRTVLLLCFVVGAIGVSKQLTGRQIVWLAILIPLLSLGIGILAELRHGTFRPWAGDYRFSGSMHPNTQGLYLTSLCLGSFSLARATPIHRLFLYGCFALGLIFLILTKSRTSVAGMMISLAPLWLLKSSIRSKVLLTLGATWCIATAAFVLLVIEDNPENDVSQLALLGRQEQASSLTGRLPIWEQLMPRLEERPLTGYGYDSFWTPETIEDVSSELHWGIREAHNAYIDTALGTGLIGLGLILATILLGMLAAAKFYLRTSQPIYGFLFGLLLFGLINGFTESGMTMPMFVPFIAATGMSYLACVRPDSTTVQRSGELSHA